MGALSGGGSHVEAAERPIVTDAAVSGPGEIVIGLNGDADTYVLLGEEYLEAGAHAAEPTDGILNDRIEVSGEVDTSTAGDYELTYRVSDSSGHTAEAGFLDVGIPILEKYEVPATSFVICSAPGSDRVPIDHRSAYVSFQSHSFDLHKAGGTVGHGGVISALDTDQIVEDLTRAQEILGTTEAFAYPFGDVTEDGREAVREAGILCAFTTQNSWAHVGDDVTALPRVRISGEYELAGYVSLVNG